MFRKAERRQSKLRIALSGPSGSGKTYSAILIAKGLGGPIAMIDTENGSGELYSHLGDYDIALMHPPYHPQKYVKALQAAEESGYRVVIIDSLSHAWSGPGGVLDIHDRVSRKSANSYVAWREVNPHHNQLVEAILASHCHVIVTLRSKTSYEIQKEEGRTRVVKLGLQPIQREGLEFEFTVCLDLSVDGHIASSGKDRTGIFDGEFFTPSEETGRLMLEWLSEQENQENQRPKDQASEINLNHPFKQTA